MTYPIGVIGWGTVGQGIHRLFREDVIALYSPSLTDKKLSRWLKTEGIVDCSITINNKQEFNRCEIVVVCVPTPTDLEDGKSCNTSTVEETLDWLSNIDYKGVVLIKSAVVPSKIKEFCSVYKLRLVVSPEYLGESRYFTPFWKYPDSKEMKSHSWQVYGGKKEDTSFCVDAFKRKMSVDTVHIQTDIMTASLTKYMENCFFATKVTFCNEWFDIAKGYGIDYNELRECWLADPRINKNHTLVFPRERGYGGKCFPKDVKAIIADSEKIGVNAEIMKTVDKVNERIRNVEKT